MLGFVRMNVLFSFALNKEKKQEEKFELNTLNVGNLELPMSFMLSCSSNRRFSIFRSLFDKERGKKKKKKLSLFTVDNLSEP